MSHSLDYPEDSIYKKIMLSFLFIYFRLLRDGASDVNIKYKVRHKKLNGYISIIYCRRNFLKGWKS